MSQQFGETIHEARTRLLGQLPPGAEVFCSVGCAGAWYFDWIATSYGPVRRHIGVELYAPRPEGLPGNVEWLASSAGDLRGIADGSVDLVFSGQNVEHLFPQDLRGFLREANRVLRTGGTLCIDSPNRAVTVPGDYLQPEHILELTVPDAVELLELAGFRITAVHGILPCEDGGYRRQPIGTIREGAAVLSTDAARCFVWWIEAVRDRGVDARLDAVVDRMFLQDFPGFVRGRFRLAHGRIVSARGTDVIVEVTPEHTGFVFYGPYIPLVPAWYEAEFLVRFMAPGGELVFDVTSASGSGLHNAVTVAADPGRGWHVVKVGFLIDRFTAGIETRARSQGAHAWLRFGAQVLPVGEVETSS